jgi:hypothetical protein
MNTPSLPDSSEPGSPLPSHPAGQTGGNPQIRAGVSLLDIPAERAGEPGETSLSRRTLEKLSEVNETLAQSSQQNSGPFARFWRFITELFRGTPIENGVRKVLRDALGQCKQGKTISQRQQLELLEAMAEIFTEYTGKIVRDAGNLDQEAHAMFKVLDAYGKELKILLKSFLPRGCSNIFVLRHGVLQRPSCVKTFELLDLIDLAHDVHKFKQIFPGINLTPANVALIKARGGRVLNLINKFRQKFPDWEMTPADFALFLHRPDLVEKIIKNGKISAEYHARWQKLDKGEGFLLSCQHSGFKYTELSAKVNPDLFSEDETTKINARKNLFAAVQQRGAIFYNDFICREQNLAVHLPNGVVIEGSVEWQAANPRETAKEAHRDYLCYVLDKFHGAYGNEAPAAFLVFMQNLTGTGNSATGLPFTYRHFKRSWPNFLGNGSFFGNLLARAQRSLTITMDSKFNITGDLIYDMAARSNSNGGAVPDDNDIIDQASICGALLPEGYDPNGENNVMAIGERFYVPARCKESETDLGKRWEQSREDGIENQDTHLRFIASW